MNTLKDELETEKSAREEAQKEKESLAAKRFASENQLQVRRRTIAWLDCLL